jgi:hypothetical protein
MIAQKRPPALAPRSMAANHVLGDRRLSHFEAELQQFAMNARRAPDGLSLLISRDERP